MEQTILKAQAPRTTLMELLDSLSERRVIYIHAPAGFGKTVSSSLWIGHREALTNTKHAWVNLDEYDNKPAEFCGRFTGALASLQPDNAALCEIAANPSFSLAPVEFTLRALGLYNEEKNESILVLDDLHTITNDENLKLLPVLFKRLPKSCKILLLSRAAPPDNFSEMVAKEELAVVDAGYLQFTGNEIKIFFNKNGRYLTTQQADEIARATGGWAIGVRALLLSGEKSYNVDLTDRYLDNFLKTHIWERWDDRLRNFMTLVSVVEELTPEICQWLTAGEKTLKKADNAQEILAELARENAFLRETGKNTYRFHDLFREFLLRILGKHGERLTNRQWNRAGEYFYGKKDYFRAVAYYSKGKNIDGMAKSFYQMYNYDSPYTSIEDMLYCARTTIGDSVVKKHPFLLEARAWAAWVDGCPEELEGILDRYYKMFSEILIQNPRSAVTVMLLRFGVDYRQDLSDVVKTFKKIPFKGLAKAATPSLTQNMPFFHRSCRDFSEFGATGSMTLLEKNIGVIIGAEFAVIKECLYAGFEYEKGNLYEAREHALLACSNIPDGCSAEIMFCAMMILSSVLFTEGQSAQAYKITENIENMILWKNAFYLNANLHAFQYRLRLTNGDRDAANEWLDNNDENLYGNLSFFKLYKHFTTARAYIVMGNYTNAVLLLNKILSLSERYRRTLDVIEARVLLAIVYWRKGRGGQTALEFLEQAVITAYEYGYTQVFANEGAELVNMLHKLQKRTIQKSYTGDIPASFVKTLYIAAVVGAKRFKGLAGGTPPLDLTFTDRQKTVMSLLCDGCSRNEIAEKMNLKPYTVKSHIELIYKKLNVSNNIEAVIKIKEMGIADGSK